jgi:ATP-binding cassette subfamily B protein
MHMALLEVLPEAVENTLRDLRVQASNGHSAHSLMTTPNGSATTRGTPEETTPTSREPDETKMKPVVFETDIRSNGTFGPEWVVLEKDNLYVFAPNGNTKAHLRYAIPLNTIEKARAEVHIGNGTLEVRTKTELITLVRFSQAAVAEANAMARRIMTLAKGDTPAEESLDEKTKRCPKCKRALPEDSEVCPACINKKAVMLRLFRFLAPYKSKAMASVLVLLGITALELVPPYVGGHIVDHLAVTYARGGSFMPVVWLVGMLATARLAASVLQYYQRRINAWLGARILVDIRIMLYEKFQMLSLGYYDKRSVGSVMSRVTNDSDHLWDVLTDGIPWFISNLLTLVGIGFVLLKMDWQLALLLFIPGPFIYGLTKWFMPRAHRRWHHLWHRISKMYSALNSTLHGMRVVKAFAQEDREVERFRQRNQNVFEASFQANALWATYWPLIGILMAIGSYIIWLVGGHKVLQGTMTIGTLMAFNGYLWQFYGPFQNFSRALDWATRSMTAAERVFEVLDTEPDVRQAAKPVALPEMKGKVEFNNVSFTYDKARRVLEEFTLTVQPGEMIGLVGHSGAGKSTIINLLSRFYDVTEGSIKIDDVDIREIDQRDFRRQFGIVLQEPYLFPGTIRDNIAYAKADATIEDIMQAAKAANCHEFILKFPDGYDTQVGDRGQRLSGGERQRISIARAILHDPKILILDEATASVDTETEKQIQEAIARLIQNRTTFAIAHRLSTLRNASRLVVMKDGKMVECGTHDELMQKDGEYAKLVKIQEEVNKLRAV